MLIRWTIFISHLSVFETLLSHSISFSHYQVRKIMTKKERRKKEKEMTALKSNCQRKRIIRMGCHSPLVVVGQVAQALAMKKRWRRESLRAELGYRLRLVAKRTLSTYSSMCMKRRFERGTPEFWRKGWSHRALPARFYFSPCKRQFSACLLKN